MARPVTGWQVLTEMRVRRETLRWSRQQLAERVDGLLPRTHGLTYETIQEWERRERIPSAQYAQPLCTLLGANDSAELGLGHSPKAAGHWSWATQADRRAEIQRRAVRTLAARAGGAALLPAPELVAAAQLLGCRPRVCPAMVTDAQRVASRLAVVYATEPAHADIARAARAHARTLTDLLRRASMTPNVRTRLQAVAADACALSGFVALDAGRLGEAGLWLRRSSSLARHADDARLEAAALVACSWLDSPVAVGASGNAPDQAIAALERACAMVQYAPPALQVWAYAYLARDLAGNGDADGSARALDRAWDALTDIDSEDGEWGWFSGHGELRGWESVRLQSFDAMRMLTLGHLNDGLPLAAAVLDETTNPGRRARLLGDLCAGWAKADNPYAACAAGIAALDAAQPVGFTAAVHHLRQARATFDARWNRLACVTELDERLAPAWTL